MKRELTGVRRLSFVPSNTPGHAVLRSASCRLRGFARDGLLGEDATGELTDGLLLIGQSTGQNVRRQPAAATERGNHISRSWRSASCQRSAFAEAGVRDAYSAWEDCLKVLLSARG